MDLEKALDQVSRKLIESALRRKAMPERMVKAVMVLYLEFGTKVRMAVRVSDELEVTKKARDGVP